MLFFIYSFFFFFNDTATTEIYTLSYTTLFRSVNWPLGETQTLPQLMSGVPPASTSRLVRSEEHTSELQSHSDLVCRLLLEKKKKKKKKKNKRKKQTDDRDSTTQIVTTKTS